jgi:hypothetical protein
MRQKKGNGSLMALKLDIEKAFNSMDSFENFRASWFSTHFDKLDQSMYYHIFLLHSP